MTFRSRRQRIKKIVPDYKVIFDTKPICRFEECRFNRQQELLNSDLDLPDGVALMDERVTAPSELHAVRNYRGCDNLYLDARTRFQIGVAVAIHTGDDQRYVMAIGL